MPTPCAGSCLLRPAPRPSRHALCRLLPGQARSCHPSTWSPHLPEDQTRPLTLTQVSSLSLRSPDTLDVTDFFLPLPETLTTSSWRTDCLPLGARDGSKGTDGKLVYGFPVSPMAGAFTRRDENGGVSKLSPSLKGHGVRAEMRAMAGQLGRVHSMLTHRAVSVHSHPRPCSEERPGVPEHWPGPGRTLERTKVQSR